MIESQCIGCLYLDKETWGVASDCYCAYIKNPPLDFNCNYHSKLRKDSEPVCIDCSTEVDRNLFNYVVVTNEIWARYGEGYDFLCSSCIIKRIGRTITLEDIYDCPANEEYRAKMLLK